MIVMLTRALSRTLPTCLCAVALVGVAAPAAEPSASASPTTLTHCLVTAINDVEIPSLRTGHLKSIVAKEGMEVEVDQLLAQLDDAEAIHQLASAEAERKAAHKKADSKLEELYAQATHDVSLAEHEAALAANDLVANSVSDIEVMRLELATKQAALKIDLSRFNRDVLQVELGVADAKAELAKTDLDRRRLRAPISGEIAEVHFQPGEWVEAGETVLRIVHVEQLRVEGFVRVRDIAPVDVIGKPVRVHVELARGKRYEFDGKITFASPLIEAGGQYRIWAEVKNRKENEQWILRPGMQAEMTIAP